MARKHRKNPQHFCCPVCSVLFHFLSHMDCCTPGFPILHHLLELAQTHVHWCCHPTVLASVIPFSTCLQTFPVPGFFLMSQIFASGGESIGFSVSASVFPMNIQGWFPLGLTGLISLQSKGLSRVFSNTTVQKHLPSLWSNSYIHTWLLEKL